MISLIIPSYNNLRHLKNAYASIQKHAPEAETILLDDGSTDDTWEWIQQQDCVKFRSEKRVGHTILYDKGIELATNDIVGILHADMIIGPNYIQNMLKHLKQGVVVCGTRIEPPLHPEGKEKIIRDFGMDFDSLNITAFEQFCVESQITYDNQTTKGMFAPWIIYKKDFQAIGGHDPLFAPFPYEDSDIFQRWILNGYELIQSRDAFVYHLTCRGHRWTEKIGENDNDFKVFESRASRNYLRKWGSWIKNDEYQYPIITPKYSISYLVKECTPQLLELLEPWCNKIYIDNEAMISQYVDREQINTKFNLNNRVCIMNSTVGLDCDDIVVDFSASMLNGDNFNILAQLPAIIKDNGEVGTFELDAFRITINHIEELQNKLIECNTI